MANFIKKPKNNIRLADQAADRIREMIISEELPMGEPIAEIPLSNAFGMSRTPIREAISQLEQEGLLKTIPGRGAFVAEITIQDIHEINELRRVLEPLAIESAIEEITDQEICQQHKIWLNFKHQYDKTDKCPKSDLLAIEDHKLHELFSKKCKNKRLRNFLNILRIQTLRYMSAYWSTEEYVNEIIDQHIEILESLKSRDLERAQKAIKKHIKFNRKFYSFN